MSEEFADYLRSFHVAPPRELERKIFRRSRFWYASAAAVLLALAATIWLLATNAASEQTSPPKLATVTKEQSVSVRQLRRHTLSGIDELESTLIALSPQFLRKPAEIPQANSYPRGENR